MSIFLVAKTFTLLLFVQLQLATEVTTELLPISGDQTEPDLQLGVTVDLLENQSDTSQHQSEESAELDLDVRTQLVIRLAQCRALCLDKFGSGESCEALLVSLESHPLLDVSKCWTTCHLLEDPSTKQKSVCDSKWKQCLIGCQAACEFHHEPENLYKTTHPVALPVQHVLVIKVRDDDSKDLISVTWPPPPPALHQGHVVYSLVNYHHLTWTLLDQTIANQMSISKKDLVPNDLRLLAVTSQGLSHVYASLPTVTGRQGRSDPWHFRVTSQIHQQFLVMTELEWDAQEEIGDMCYLLTWEVYGGLVRGHLVTDSVLVTISLWPDTTYRLQVGMIDLTQVKVEKGKSIIGELEGRLASGVQLPVKSYSDSVQVNTTAPDPAHASVAQLTKKSPRSAKSFGTRHDFSNPNDPTRQSTFCHWNSHPNPSSNEIRACRLIWAILIICLLLITLMFLYFSIAVYMAMQKQMYFQKLHRSCSVASIYSRQLYRLKKNIFKKTNHYIYPTASENHSTLELLPLTDSSTDDEDDMN